MIPRVASAPLWIGLNNLKGTLRFWNIEDEFRVYLDQMRLVTAENEIWQMLMLFRDSKVPPDIDPTPLIAYAKKKRQKATAEILKKHGIQTNADFENPDEEDGAVLYENLEAEEHAISRKKLNKLIDED